MDKVYIAEQLEQSLTPGSIIVSNTVNKAKYLPAGLANQILTTDSVTLEPAWKTKSTLTLVGTLPVGGTIAVPVVLLTTDTPLLVNDGDYYVAGTAGVYNLTAFGYPSPMQLNIGDKIIFNATDNAYVIISTAGGFDVDRPFAKTGSLQDQSTDAILVSDNVHRSGRTTFGATEAQTPFDTIYTVKIGDDAAEIGHTRTYGTDTRTAGFQMKENEIAFSLVGGCAMCIVDPTAGVDGLEPNVYLGYTGTPPTTFFATLSAAIVWMNRLELKNVACRIQNTTIGAPLTLDTTHYINGKSRAWFFSATAGQQFVTLNADLNFYDTIAQSTGITWTTNVDMALRVNNRSSFYVIDSTINPSASVVTIIGLLDGIFNFDAGINTINFSANNQALFHVTGNDGGKVIFSNHLGVLDSVFNVGAFTGLIWANTTQRRSLETWFSSSLLTSIPATIDMSGSVLYYGTSQGLRQVAYDVNSFNYGQTIGAGQTPLKFESLTSASADGAFVTRKSLLVNETGVVIVGTDASATVNKPWAATTDLQRTNTDNVLDTASIHHKGKVTMFATEAETPFDALYDVKTGVSTLRVAHNRLYGTDTVEDSYNNEDKTVGRIDLTIDVTGGIDTKEDYEYVTLGAVTAPFSFLTWNRCVQFINAYQTKKRIFITVNNTTAGTRINITTGLFNIRSNNDISIFGPAGTQAFFNIAATTDFRNIRGLTFTRCNFTSAVDEAFKSVTTNNLLILEDCTINYTGTGRLFSCGGGNIILNSGTLINMTGNNGIVFGANNQNFTKVQIGSDTGVVNVFKGSRIDAGVATGVRLSTGTFLNTLKPIEILVDTPNTLSLLGVIRTSDIHWIFDRSKAWNVDQASLTDAILSVSENPATATSTLIGGAHPLRFQDVTSVSADMAHVTTADLQVNQLGEVVKLSNSWSTIGRPAGAIAGRMGFNTTTLRPEFFSGVAWVSL